ncbi:Retrotransposon protein, Ty3-gypsy subclass [Phytophthora megakarya]|uniref:Retrotransposon protein, Ty3-gypsy subclass n=1 Tax=Phytophthora megakarya TaxID=4795 RepID=A0A225W5M5_9STRA|nr:Retrotransposon protein, Ty3-gypsy subclass [Phytophthora megakarya]
MGGTNSVVYVQSTVQEMFAEDFNQDLLIWIDDLLSYDDTDEGRLVLLKTVLNIWKVKELTLNPNVLLARGSLVCRVMVCA